MDVPPGTIEAVTCVELLAVLQDADSVLSPVAVARITAIIGAHAHVAEVVFGLSSDDLTRLGFAVGSPAEFTL
jgi:hypothetical protein